MTLNFQGVSVNENELVDTPERGNYDETDVEDLLVVLSKTTNNGLISRVAMALFNLGSNEAIPYMLNILSNGIDKNKKGTMLYGIKGLKYEKYISDN